MTSSVATSPGNLFTRIQRFPEPVDGDLNTESFLAAADGIRAFVHVLGPTLFSPVTSDIQGNIDKVTAILVKDKSKYATLSAIIDEEKGIAGFRIGTDALLWLSRAFDFIALFLTLWIQDYESGQRKEDLTGYFKNAYEITLKRYHNWLVTKIVFVVLSGAPGRDQLLSALFSSDDQTEERINPVTASEEELLFKNISEHVHRLNGSIQCIRSMFDAVAFDWKA